MSLTPDHLDCVSAIYDAVLDRGKLVPMLDRLAAFNSARSAVIIAVDPRHEALATNEAASCFSKAQQAVYAERYQPDDAEGVAGLMRTPAHDWVRDQEHYARPLESYGVYQWFDREFAIRHRASTRLNDHGVWFDAFSLFFDKARPNLSAAEEAAFRPILPHLSRLIALDRPFQLLRARYAAVMAALDRLAMGVVILGPRGDAILRNREAERILGLDDGLSIDRAGRLRAHDGDVSAGLAAAVAGALRTSSREDAESGARLVIPRRSGGDGFIAEIDALRGAEDELEPGLAGALVVLIDPDNPAPVSIDGMSALYGLTPAEAEVLALIVAGQDAPVIAETRGASVTTIRTQLRAIAEKTRTPNRAALVRLALTVNPPVERFSTAD